MISYPKYKRRTIKPAMLHVLIALLHLSPEHLLGQKPTCLYNQQICMLGGNNVADQGSRMNYVSQIDDPSKVAFLNHSSLHQGTTPSFRHLHTNSSQSESKNYQAMQISNLLDYIRPSYNPWNSNTFPGCKNLIQHMNMAAGNIHTSEVSGKKHVG